MNAGIADAAGRRPPGRYDVGVREALRRMRWAFGLCRRHAPGLTLACWAIALVATALPAGAALAVRGLVNSVNAGLSDDASFRPGSVVAWLVVGFAMTVGTVATGAATRFLGRRLETDLEYGLRGELLDRLGATSYARFEDPRFHEALLRAQDAPEAHVAHCLVYGLDLVTRAVQGASLMAILFVIEPLLFVLLVPIALPYVVFQWRLSRRQFEEVDARAEKRRWIGYHTGVMSGAELAAEVRSLGLAPLFIARCRSLMAEFRDLKARYDRVDFAGNLVFALLSVVAVYLALALASFSIVDGRATIGDLAIYAAAAAQLRAIVEGGIGLLAALRWEVFHVGNLRAFLAMPAEPARPPGTQRAPITGGIAFLDVAFTYASASAPTLEHISFEIAPGETVALVGDNGAGKTTIAKLIAGLYVPTSGVVSFDGIDAREFDPDHLRRHVSCLFQHFGRYAASAADNIAFGDWERLIDDDAAIEAVARSAGVDGLVRGMPDGYRTMLGVSFGAHVPSGGEWQQIAIARMFARDARVLVLDEPTAHLDIDTEYRLFLRYRELARGRTIVLISHRFSTVRMADRILVLDAGRIVEQGTHDDLMREGGRYAALYDMHRRHLGVT
jgi:ATP-binding cassette subfamily B protein